ncbi:MAG: hypothetical protein LBP60_03550 [Spirochaetaceae bacterium]|jgi:hypothetical protein|nr:hypothetical protein [Spirochaetaceae bacterium]
MLRFSRPGRFCIISAPCLLILLGGSLVSCIPEAMQSFGPPEPEQKSTIIALADKTEALKPAGEPAVTEPAGSDALILERGNFWTTGIPGFGENALSAFSGEYRIPGKTELLKVWLCREFLYYDGWITGTNGVLLKTVSAGLAAAMPAKDGIWTAIVFLPPTLSPEEQTRFLGACMSKFSDFPGSGGSWNLSLPAIINF